MIKTIKIIAIVINAIAFFGFARIAMACDEYDSAYSSTDGITDIFEQATDHEWNGLHDHEWNGFID